MSFKKKKSKRNQNETTIYTNNLDSPEKDLMNLLNNGTTLKLIRNPFYEGVGLKNLPDNIDGLKNLTELVLSHNLFNGFPENICKLQNLKHLALDHCQIKGKVPENAQNLVSMERIMLDYNKLEVPNLTNLKNLQYFSMVKNELETIPQLHYNNLTYVNVSGNSIKEIPDVFFESCIKIEKLYLQNNGLKTIPSIGHLKNLKCLNISQNKLDNLPDDIGDLKSLKKFNVSVNSISALPNSIGNLKNLKELEFFCGENPLKLPPINIADRGLDAIYDYFIVHARDENVETVRVKFMVLGDKNAGKTALAKSIQGIPCDITDGNESTIGIDFYKWKPQQYDVEVLIVDCAGEKKYTLTHQLFFSVGMIFAVVVDIKKYQMDETYFFNKVGYWINVIVSRVPKAVIMIIPTHIDEENDDVSKTKFRHIIRLAKDHADKRNKIFSEKAEKNTYNDKVEPFLPNSFKIKCNEELYNESIYDKPIMNMIPVSNTTLQGVTLLISELMSIVGNPLLCPNIKQNVNKDWYDLEEYCTQLAIKKSLCPVIKLDDLFEQFGKIKTIDEMKNALEYIDSMGPISYFHSIEKMKDVVFLEPKWFLTLLKKVFSKSRHLEYKKEFLQKFDLRKLEFDQDLKLLYNNSQLSIKLLKCFWVGVEDDTLLTQIVNLFKKFELFSDLNTQSKSGGEGLLVPWYFKDDEPKLSNNFQDHIVLSIETGGVLPDGFMHRFIIRVHSILKTVIPWEHGFKGFTPESGNITCRNTNCQHVSSIEIVASAEKRDILNQWTSLIQIMKVFKDLIKEWKGISYQVFVACPLCFKQEKTFFWKFSKEMMEDCICSNELHKISRYRLCPPFGILYRHLDNEEREKIEIESLDGKMSNELFMKISYCTSLNERSSELARILGVNPNLLDLNGKTESDRIWDVLVKWKSSFAGDVDPTRKDLIEKLSKMRPYPTCAVESVYLK